MVHGDHFRAGRPAEGFNAEVDIPREDDLVSGTGMIAEATTEYLSDELSDDAFARLRIAVLI